jgi:hypothetical protein
MATTMSQERPRLRYAATARRGPVNTNALTNPSLGIATRLLGAGGLTVLVYKWINRKPSTREQRRDRLDEEIKRLFTASDGTHGSARITRDLRDAGRRVSTNTVAASKEDSMSRGLTGIPAPTDHHPPSERSASSTPPACGEGSRVPSLD